MKCIARPGGCPAGQH